MGEVARKNPFFTKSEKVDAKYLKAPKIPSFFLILLEKKNFYTFWIIWAK